MRRITPGKVLYAYRKLSGRGLRPECVFLRRRADAEGKTYLCGCPISALWIIRVGWAEFRHMGFTLPDLGEMARTIGLEVDYAAGFIHGFDGSHANVHPPIDPAKAAGIADGQATRLEVARLYHLDGTGRLSA